MRDCKREGRLTEVNLPSLKPHELGRAARTRGSVDTRIAEPLDLRNREQQSVDVERGLEIGIRGPPGVFLVESMHVREATKHQPELGLPLMFEHCLRRRCHAIPRSPAWI